MTTRDPFAAYLNSIGAGSTESFPTGNIFANLLEEEPDIPFFGAMQRANLTPNQKDHFRSQRQNIYNQFQGLLDQQIRSGQTPDLRFADFINDFDFNRSFQQLSPRNRPGGSSSRFNPSLTFLNP